MRRKRQMLSDSKHRHCDIRMNFNDFLGNGFNPCLFSNSTTDNKYIKPGFERYIKTEENNQTFCDIKKFACPNPDDYCYAVWQHNGTHDNHDILTCLPITHGMICGGETTRDQDYCAAHLDTVTTKSFKKVILVIFLNSYYKTFVLYAQLKKF